ncbi:hypothetical protein CJ206_00845 [Dolosicoccus paucivorans]|uniref:MFS transporter n=1 Tax=Dolosicoccus paucivorans TaxID=84521 RepID=UPI000C8096CA|nr:MFS transporter [Dolosicoccus paucivorans]PMB85088.1 hypothetical protein CJ206_00845 [Dolosicoccus paucivorans]
MENNLSTGRKYFLVFLLALMFSAAYLLPYIKYVFYEPLLVALNTTNEKAGFLLTAYAVMNTLTLIPGGWFSDKYSPKKIIVFSSIGTGLLNLLLSFSTNYPTAVVVWIGLGFTTIFAFWGAVIKAVRLLGDENEQGRLYGFYTGFQGVINTVAALVATFIMSKFADMTLGFKGVLMFYAAICIGSAILFQIYYPEELDSAGRNEDAKAVSLSDIFVVLKMPATWLMSFMIFSIYGVFSGSTFMTPYVENAVGIVGVLGTIIAIFRTYLARAIFAPVGGIVADKNKKLMSNIILWSLLSALSFLVLNLFGTSLSNVVVVVIILLSSAVIYMNFGVMWAVAEELKVPRHLYGTMIGVASIIGYLPDMFMHTMFGRWLDAYGVAGYQNIFYFLIALCMIGVVTGLVIKNRSKQ